MFKTLTDSLDSIPNHILKRMPDLLLFMGEDASLPIFLTSLYCNCQTSTLTIKSCVIMHLHKLALLIDGSVYCVLGQALMS